MAYTPTTWESSVTALSAQNMNHIEAGIEEAHEKLEPTALAAALVDIIYPVGWLIETTDATFNPNTALGGEWELLGEGQVIISAGANYEAGQRYGANTKTITPSGTVGSHTLTTNQIPAHTHGSESLTGSVLIRKSGSDVASLAGRTGILSLGSGDSGQVGASFDLKPSSSHIMQKLSVNATHTHNSVGGGKGHTHSFTGTSMDVDVKQDSTAAYIWHRTA